MVVESKNVVITQLKETAFMLKAFSMEGRAILTEEIRNGLRNEVMETIARADFCDLVQLIQFDISAKKRCYNVIISVKPSIHRSYVQF